MDAPWEKIRGEGAAGPGANRKERRGQKGSGPPRPGPERLEQEDPDPAPPGVARPGTPAIRILALGPAQILVNGNKAARREWGYRLPRALVVYLRIYKSVLKTKICLDFWPNSSSQQAGRALTSAICRARRIVGQDSILVEEDVCRWNSAVPCSCDVDEFEDLRKQALVFPPGDPRAIAPLEQALSPPGAVPGRVSVGLAPGAGGKAGRGVPGHAPALGRVISASAGVSAGRRVLPAGAPGERGGRGSVPGADARLRPGRRPGPGGPGLPAVSPVSAPGT